MSDPASPSPSGTPNPEPSLADALKAIGDLTKEIGDLKTDSQNKSRYIAGLEKQIKEIPKVEPKKDDTPGDTKLVEEVKALKAAQKAATEKESRLKANSAQNAIRDLMVAKGVKPELAKSAARWFYRDNETKIVVNEDADTGEYSFAVKEGDRNSDLNTHLEAWFATPEGMATLPVKNQPQFPSGAASGRQPMGTKVQYTRAQFLAGQYDPKVLQGGNFELVD